MIRDGEAGTFPEAPEGNMKKKDKEKLVSLPESQNHSTLSKERAASSLPEIRKSTGPAAFILSLLKQGSLSLEAAAVIPLFLICILSLFSFFNILCTQVLLQTSMEEVGRKAAAGIYAEEILTGQTEIKDPGVRTLIEEALVSAALESEVRKSIRETNGAYADAWSVEGGEEGISFLGSGYDPVNQAVVLRASFKIRGMFLPGTGFSVSQASYHRAYTGKKDEAADSGPIVYITRTGTVYHTSLSCHYLKLSISAVSRGSLPGLKNASGKAYRECEICRAGTEDTVYITAYGDCFHSNRNCSGLKRTILSIPLSQVGSRRKCSKCAARDGP